MTSSTLLLDAQEVLGKQWAKDSSAERRRILGLARDALGFLAGTGQRHQFDDFHRGLVPTVPLHPSGRFEDLEERVLQAEGFFTKLHDESTTQEEAAQLHAILDAFRYITATDQFAAFSEYLTHVEAGGPPYVVASFETQEEAEHWLKGHPQPPELANILVANHYRCVTYDRDTGSRRLAPSRDLEYYLAELKKEAPPTAVASFGSPEEAEAWWRSQPQSTRWAWVSIAGEFYLAAYYPNIGHRALFPLSRADGYEVEPGESPAS